MRWLFIVLMLFGASVALAFDGDAASQSYYAARAECRVGETEAGESLSHEQIASRCNEVERLAKSLEENGYCWDEKEQEWVVCSFTN